MAAAAMLMHLTPALHALPPAPLLQRRALSIRVAPRMLVGLKSLGAAHSPTLLQRRALSLRGGSVAPRMLAGLQSLGAAYAAALVTNPILTKSLTSAATFALSDVAAQRLEPGERKRDVRRTVVTALIGLLYFGPALHYYLEFVTWLVPGGGIRDTLLKTLVGQLGFGPAITMIFFGAFLVADHGLVAGLLRWPAKIRQDLFVTWMSELCFWPFVDVICYSFVAVRYIPLGYNLANFFWTIFLSLQAARAVESDGAAPRAAAGGDK